MNKTTISRGLAAAFILSFIVGIGAQARPRSQAAADLPVAVNISHSASNSETPLIGVDRNGAAYVVWYEQLAPRQFYFATNKSGSWSTPLWLDRLYYDVEEAGWPDLAVSPSGSAHLSYQDGKDPSLSYDIMGKSLSGSTWGPTVFVSNNTSASCYSGCAINPVDDGLFVVWQDSNGNTGVGEWNILLRYRTAAGVWSANQTLPVGWGYMPKIVIDGTGTAHMVWGNSHGRTLWYSHNRTPQIASGWTTPLQIKYNCGLEWSIPQIACDLAGDVAFVWMDGATGYEQISCLRLKKDGTFYSEVNVSQSAVPATDGAVALNPLNGDVLTAWAQGGDIYANACLGGTWTGAYNVTRGSGTAGMPRVAVDATGRAHLVYAQAVSGGATDIIYMSIAAAIQVTAPNGGEVWNVGSSQTIRWTAPSSLATVKIELSTDHGASFQAVAAAAPNTGGYAWTVPNTPSSNGLIRISEPSYGTPSDVSDAAFTIRIAGPAPTIKLSKTKLNFAAIVGGSSSSSQSVLISNSGVGTLAWTATSNKTWLGVAPGSGAGNGILQISVNASGQAVGTQSGTVTVTDPNATNNPQTIDISLKIEAAGTGALPFGSFDTPINGTSGVMGQVPVSGWALDDIEAAKVEIKRDPVGEDASGAIGPDGLVYIGDGIFVEGARPDVETAYPAYPLNSRAGWGYMLLTNLLPGQGNGTFKIYAFAFDKEGNKALLGTKTITCSNATAVKPFGTIDTPAQGGDASGTAYLNFGWILSPQPNMIPKDGSTITAWVDGVRVGTLKDGPNAYNQYRADIAGAFPGLKNTNGAVGFVYLNTTLYANGVHSIQWVATDDAGHTDGIGSRYFNIVNNATSSLLSNPSSQVIGVNGPASFDSVMNLPPSAGLRSVKRGVGLQAEPATLQPDRNGILRVDIREVDRVELDLKSSPGEIRPVFNASEYAGYMVVGNRLRPLPIGSTLDPQKGTFSWLPGPGFLGRYEFLFVRKDQVGGRSRMRFIVKIVPKFGSN